MVRAKTKTAMMSLRTILPALAAVLVVLTAGAEAQQSLGDLVAEGGFEWMIGRWTATTDEGDKVLLEYKWELNKHLLSVHLKGSRYEYRGIIFYDAPKDQVVQIGVDGQGGNGKGMWGPMDDKALLKYEHTGSNWEINRMALAHSRVDANTMKVEVYEMDSAAQIDAWPSSTLQFKRVKDKPAEKAETKT